MLPLGLIVLCALVAATSVLSNVNLPQHSLVTDRLSEAEKARLSEALHLRKTLGDSVWPGWSHADIPLIVYNERYAFLVGLADPAPGWKKIPSMEPRGGPWEIVPDDLFEGQPYYRTPITDPKKTPEGFTVLVGDRWVATFQTREYSELTFYRDFRAELPPAVRNLVPVRLVWEALMGKTESYIAALEHESFHAYQGIRASRRLVKGESLYSVEAAYPFDAMADAWEREMAVLVQAASAPDAEQARQLVREFLTLRAERRAVLTPEQIELEQLREWEEGLAKYAELEITRRAGTDKSYRPLDEIQSDPDFKHYADRERFWLQQFMEVKRTSGRSGDTRFYYSGNAMAVVLDRLHHSWKPVGGSNGEPLENMLWNISGWEPPPRNAP